MMEILEDRGLSFLFPLLRIQSELWKQIQTDPSATAIFKWIKDKVQNDLHQSPGFVNILTTRLEDIVLISLKKKNENSPYLKYTPRNFLTRWSCSVIVTGTAGR